MFSRRKRQDVSPASVLQVFQDNQKLLIPLDHLQKIRFQGLLFWASDSASFIHSLYIPMCVVKGEMLCSCLVVSQRPCDPYLQVDVTHGEIEPKLQ
jgi:hypothetical protein